MVSDDVLLILSYKSLPDVISIDLIENVSTRFSVICLPDFPSLDSDNLDFAYRYEVADMSYGSKERSPVRRTDIYAALDKCLHNRPEVVVCDARAFVGNEYYLRMISQTGHGLVVVVHENHSWDSVRLEEMLSAAKVINI